MHRPAAAALFRRRPIMFVWPGNAGKPRAGRNGSGPSPDRPRDASFLDQPGEELLSEIAGVVGGMPAAADEGVDRVPVKAAQLGERLPGRRVFGGGNQAPAGRREVWHEATMGERVGVNARCVLKGEGARLSRLAILAGTAKKPYLVVVLHSGH